jgi:succinate dehydrogenase / fumarate reductase flavoprotein subunit
MLLDGKVPGGPVAEKWDRHRFELKLVNPANKRKFNIIVVGTGLAAERRRRPWPNWDTMSKPSASRTPRAAPTASLPRAASMPPKITPTTATASGVCFTTRSRAGISVPGKPMSIAWPNVSNDIIDQCVAQGIPFARDYGGLLANRSFGGAQVSRTFYARGQTGQQLLLGAYSALMRQIGCREGRNVPTAGNAGYRDGQRPCQRHRRPQHDQRSIGAPCRRCRRIGHRRLWQCVFLSTNAMASNVTANFAAYRKGALFANPCFTQIHPTCIPGARHVSEPS